MTALTADQESNENAQTTLSLLGSVLEDFLRSCFIAGLYFAARKAHCNHD